MSIFIPRLCRHRRRRQRRDRSRTPTMDGWRQRTQRTDCRDRRPHLRRAHSAHRRRRRCERLGITVMAARHRLPSTTQHRLRPRYRPSSTAIAPTMNTPITIVLTTIIPSNNSSISVTPRRHCRFPTVNTNTNTHSSSNSTTRHCLPARAHPRCAHCCCVRPPRNTRRWHRPLHRRSRSCPRLRPRPRLHVRCRSATVTSITNTSTSTSGTAWARWHSFSTMTTRSILLQLTHDLLRLIHRHRRRPLHRIRTRWVSTRRGATTPRRGNRSIIRSARTWCRSNSRRPTMRNGPSLAAAAAAVATMRQ